MMTFLYFLVTIGFTVGMYLKFPNVYLILPFLIGGLIVAFLFIILLIILMLPIMKNTSYTNKFKLYVTKSVSYLVNKVFLGIDIEIIGKENLTKDNILTAYANHKSYIDPLIIMAVAHRPIAFTPKTGVYKIPVINKWMKYLGSMPIDRSSNRNTAQNMVNAIKNVKNGLMLTIFPEGGIKTRDDEKMVDMRAGAYKIAMKAGADLLPITIIGVTNVKKRAPFRRTKVKVVVHKQVRYDDIKDMQTNEVADMMFKIINDGYEKYSH